MLEPQDRRLLMASLRPPDGYVLDTAIGTTYSLDLLALLTAPLAFTLFDLEDADGRPTADPLAILEAVRRYVDRIAIFCQAGEIKPPSQGQLLFTHLENAVIQVTPRVGGVFHPKLWILRFAALDQPTLYRLLCLTRNLTFDQSWDTVLRLDGELMDRQRAFAMNHPLADFVRALPGLAVRTVPVPERVTTDVNRVQEELRRVQFEVPEGFDEMAFWPIGIGGSAKWPFDRIDRALVISPFVSDKCLSRLTDAGKDHVLVSRPDCLATLKPTTLARFSSVRVMREAAEPEFPEAGEIAGQGQLEGLHAKIYVIDAGWQASVFTGSANATDAAFHTNVEFLVELRGKKSRWGVEATLALRDGQPTLATLLQEVDPEQPPALIDETGNRLEKRIAETRRALWEVGFRGIVKAEARSEFRLTLNPTGSVLLSANITVRCWPITLHEQAERPVVAGAAIAFGPVSFEALTTFFVFEVNATEGDRALSARFVLNLPVEGMPADRRERVLRLLLRDRGQVMRLLLLLLAEGGLDVQALFGAGSRGGGSPAPHADGGNQLLESLLRKLDRDPARLDEVAHLVADLRQATETRDLLPENFDEIWGPIWAIRERLRNEPGQPT